MGPTGFTAQAYGAGDAAELRACLLRPLALAVGFGCLVILLQGPVRLVALWDIAASAEVAGPTGVCFDIRLWIPPDAPANNIAQGERKGAGEGTGGSGGDMLV